jgi:hypothetical protein
LAPARQALDDEEGVCCDAQRGVMVESSPASALVVIQTEFLFEVVVVAFDAPAC